MRRLQGTSQSPERKLLEETRVLSDLTALRLAPLGSYQKVRVLVEGNVEELQMDPFRGPVVYRHDGSREWVTHSPMNGNRCPSFDDHGFGPANKPWHQLTESEREIALITAAKRNRRLREWKGHDFIPLEYEGTEPGVWQPSPAPAMPEPDGEPLPAEEREFDIVIYGATGYTGQLCTMQLDMLLSKTGETHSWAIAGRNEEKLRTMAGRCRCAPAVVRAATGEEISAMCRQTRVLISTAGPYADFGEPALKACVEQRTHYIDVTGEALWMHAMIAKYHEAARARGVAVVFSAGQESAPYEIMAYKLVRKLGPLRRLRMYMFQFGNVSGGTALTGASSVGRLSDATTFRRSRDPWLLGGRRAAPQRDDEDLLQVEQDPLFPSLWLFPFAHATTQVRVIRRSCALFEEAPHEGVAYGARFSACVREAAPKQKAAEISLTTTAAPLPGPEAAEKAAEKLQQAVSLGVQPAPGQGATLEARGLYSSDCYAVAEAESGAWAYVHHTGPDTYEITAICVVTGALCLVEELELVRPWDRGGCVTPAFAMHGTTWIERVERHPMAGTTHQRVVFDLHEGIPEEEELKAAMMERSKSAMKGMAMFQKQQIQAWGPPPLTA